jgi:hypothetical protein
LQNKKYDDAFTEFKASLPSHFAPKYYYDLALMDSENYIDAIKSVNEQPQGKP